MTNTTISGLAGGAAVSDTDILPVVESAGVGPVKKTALQFKTYFTPTLGALAALNSINNANWSGTALAPTNGGTGLSAFAAGDLLYGSAANVLARLAKGADGQVLTLAGGLPAWGTNLALGTATGTSLALGGATLGTNALAVAGTATFGSPIYLPGGSEAVPAVNFGLGAGMYSTSGVVRMMGGGVFSGEISTYNGVSYIWVPQNNAAIIFGAVIGDTYLWRDAANTLALRNGSAAQSLRVYNTWSSAGANYERGIFDFQVMANVLTIGTQMAGTGVARPVKLTSATKAIQYDTTTVSALPSAATAGAGARSFVTDSTVVASGNFGAVVAGTGANNVPVYSDGTNWRIG